MGASGRLPGSCHEAVRSGDVLAGEELVREDPGRRDAADAGPAGAILFSPGRGEQTASSTSSEREAHPVGRVTRPGSTGRRGSPSSSTSIMPVKTGMACIPSSKSTTPLRSKGTSDDSVPANRAAGCREEKCRKTRPADCSCPPRPSPGVRESVPGRDHSAANRLANGMLPVHARPAPASLTPRPDSSDTRANHLPRRRLCCSRSSRSWLRPPRA